MFGLGLGTMGEVRGANPSAFANGEAAPSGYRWEFVIDEFSGQRVTDEITNQPVVDLVSIS